MKQLCLFILITCTTLWASGQTEKVKDFDGGYGTKFGWSKAKVDAHIIKTYGATLSPKSTPTISLYSGVKMNGISGFSMRAYFNHDKLYSIAFLAAYSGETLEKEFQNDINWVNNNYWPINGPNFPTYKFWLTPDLKKAIQVVKYSNYLEEKFSYVGSVTLIGKPSKDQIIQNIQQIFQAQVGKSYKSLGGSVFKIKNRTFTAGPNDYTITETTEKYDDGKFDFERTFTYTFPLKEASVSVTDLYAHNLQDALFCSLDLRWPDNAVVQTISGYRPDPEKTYYIFIEILETVKDKLKDAFTSLIAYDNL